MLLWRGAQQLAKFVGEVGLVDETMLGCQTCPRGGTVDGAEQPLQTCDARVELGCQSDAVGECASEMPLTEAQLSSELCDGQLTLAQYARCFADGLIDGSAGSGALGNGARQLRGCLCRCERRQLLEEITRVGTPELLQGHAPIGHFAERHS